MPQDQTTVQHGSPGRRKRWSGTAEEPGASGPRAGQARWDARHM